MPTDAQHSYDEPAALVLAGLPALPARTVCPNHQRVLGAGAVERGALFFGSNSYWTNRTCRLCGEGIGRPRPAGAGPARRRPDQPPRRLLGNLVNGLDALYAPSTLRDTDLAALLHHRTSAKEEPS
jgi:hypothetical protein